MCYVVANCGTRIYVSDEDYPTANKYKWFLIKKGKSGKLYPFTKIKGKAYGFSKMVFDIVKPYCVFHINEDTLDYRREHIIICTHKQLGHIKKSPCKGSSYYGIYFSTINNKWFASVTMDGKQNILFCYDNQEDAALAADYLAIPVYGDLTKRNFPDLTFEELTLKYNEMQAKYGVTTSEKISKRLQGKTSQKSKEKKSQYVGVHKREKENMWYSGIYHGKKRLQLGRYFEEREAAIAYDMKVLELLGENARRNFPELSKEDITREYLKIEDKYAILRRRKDKQGVKHRNRSCSSKYVGVFHNKTTNRWISYIQYNKKRYHIGSYGSEEDAAKAYDEKAKELYKEKARLNFE